jgi:hypothetical protein
MEYMPPPCDSMNENIRVSKHRLQSKERKNIRNHKRGPRTAENHGETKHMQIEVRNNIQFRTQLPVGEGGETITTR